MSSRGPKGGSTCEHSPYIFVFLHSYDFEGSRKPRREGLVYIQHIVVLGLLRQAFLGPCLVSPLLTTAKHLKVVPLACILYIEVVLLYGPS